MKKTSTPKDTRTAHTCSPTGLWRCPPANTTSAGACAAVPMGSSSDDRVITGQEPRWPVVDTCAPNFQQTPNLNAAASARELPAAGGLAGDQCGQDRSVPAMRVEVWSRFARGPCSARRGIRLRLGDRYQMAAPGGGPTSAGSGDGGGLHSTGGSGGHRPYARRAT